MTVQGALTSFLAAFSIAACVSDESAVSSYGQPFDGPTPTFSAVVRPILDTHCVDCHDSEQSPTRLSLVGPETHARLVAVGRACEESDCDCQDTPRLVTPFAPEESLIWRKLDPDRVRCSYAMPPNAGLCTFDPAAATALERWIAAGAADD
jgi:hypothetical protein